jgi:hypothetical protein
MNEQYSPLPCALLIAPRVPPRYSSACRQSKELTRSLILTFTASEPSGIIA